MNDYWLFDNYWRDGFDWRFLRPWAYSFEVPTGTFYCFDWLGFSIKLHWEKDEGAVP